MPIILILSFLISIILGQKTIEILKKRRVNQIVREEALESHYVKAGTPTMGGIFVILTTIIVSIIVMITGLGGVEKRGTFLLLLLSTIGYGIVGFIDDFIKVEKRNTDGLSPKKKVLGITIVALIFSLVVLYVFKMDFKILIPFGSEVTLTKLLYIPFTILVLLSTTNALNLTDGVDGLATSVGSIILLFFGVIALQMKNIEVAVYILIVLGAFFGFLLYNWNKAKIFMGDVGSFFLGGVIGTVAMLLNLPFYLFFIAIIPVIEALSVIAQVLYFRKTGKRLFLIAPIHHHFEKKGWSETKVVAIFSLITIIGGIIAILAYI